MKVKIENTTYDAKDIPIILILDEVDKKCIAEMGTEARSIIFMPEKAISREEAFSMLDEALKENNAEELLENVKE